MADSTTVTATFDVTGWDDAPYDEPADGPRLARVTVRRTFQGGLDGDSVAELLMCQGDAEDPAAGAGYVASEVVTGVLDGRAGSFVIQHGGVMGGGEAARTFGHVVPGSGRGELAGLGGAVEIARDDDGAHTITLDVRFS